MTDVNTPRYIALIWNPRDTECARVAASQLRRLHRANVDWSEVLSAAGVRVLADVPHNSHYTCVALEGARGVVLGTLFRWPTKDVPYAPRVTTLGSEECARIVDTGGKELVQAYWGRYVAVVVDRADAVRVVRDPMGYVRCFGFTHGGVHAYFSNMEDCLHLKRPPFSVNWEYIASHVVSPENHSLETGFNEVHKLRPAECATIDGNRIERSYLWDPVAIAATSEPRQGFELIRAVRATTAQCISSWAACHGSIVHRLSGGLDSSVVLGCLRHAPTQPDITCLNYYSAGSNSDERTYARMAAEHAGLPLTELKRNAAVDLAMLLKARPSARPFLSCGYVDVPRAEAEFASQRHATAYFTGGGGDQLFYQSPALPAAADFARVHGLQPRLMSVALDIAQMTGLTVWSVLRTAIIDGVMRRKWTPFADLERYRTLVPQEVIARPGLRNVLLHDSLSKANGTPPGKLWHVRMVMAPQDYENPFAEPSDPEETEPLLASQPLVEACLRIPTFVHVKHGWDRSIARRAFVAEVPRTILRRRSKGGMEEYAREMLSRNSVFVRELLLDGQLVKHGLLDRRRLELVLTSTPNRYPTAMGEILEHVSTEAWLSVAMRLAA